MERLSAAVQQLLVDLLGRRATAADAGLEISLERSSPWPPWVTVLLVIGLASWVFWLYSREQGRRSTRWRVGLAAIRLSLVCLVLIMMYGWTVNRHRTDLPDLVVVLDDSRSMAIEDQPDRPEHDAKLTARLRRAGLVAASRWHQALSLLIDPEQGWLARLARRYRLQVYRVAGTARLVTPDPQGQFGAALRQIAPQQPASRLGVGLQQILEAQRGRPTAAVVLLSDGITTSGATLEDAAELARRRAIPLYLVGLGSEHPPRDVRLSDLIVEEAVFVDDVVRFDFQIQHDGFAGRTVAVQLADETGQVLDRQEIPLSEFAGAQPVRLSYRPSAAGVHQYIIEASALPGEFSHENNRLQRTVLVRDARVRVLMLQAYPSYEFRTLKHLLSRGVRRSDQERIIELTTVLQTADIELAAQDETAIQVFPVSREDLFSYDVLIIGDADPSLLSGSVMDNVAAFVKERGGGVVFIAGPRFTPLAWRETPLAQLLPIDLSTASTPPPTSVLSDAAAVVPTSLGLQTSYLQLGDTHAATDSIWRNLPGIYWFVAAPDLRPAARVLAEHGSLRSADESAWPIISMQFVGAGKVVFHGTDETYRWAQHLGNDIYHARYWLQLIRYLSRSKLLSSGEVAEVLTDRSSYLQGEAIRIQTRFFDDRLAPPNDDGVRVGLAASDGRRRELGLRREAAVRGTFSGFVNDLDPGDYRVWLTAPAIEPLPTARHFRVEPPAGEAAELQMKSQEMQAAAAASRGQFYRIHEVDRLLAELPRGRRVRLKSLPVQPIWNSAWLASLFVALIAAEWIVRKKVGLV